MLPLWGCYSQLIWSVPDELAEELLELSDQEFFDEVNNKFYSSAKYNFGGYFNTYLPDWIKKNNFELPTFVIDSKEAREFKVTYKLALS